MYRIQRPRNCVRIFVTAWYIHNPKKLCTQTLFSSRDWVRMMNVLPVFLYVLGNEWRKPKLMVDNHLKITTYNHSSSFYKLMSRFSLLLLPFLKKAYTILSPTGLREISGIARKSVLKRKPLPSLSRSQNLSKRRKTSFSENPVLCRITLKS